MQKQHVKVSKMQMMLTVLSSIVNISGAVHPSVPAIPEFLEKECLPAANFLHSPKSEINALTSPPYPGNDNKTLCGFISL